MLYLERVVNACSVVGSWPTGRSLDVKALKRESNAAALWLTNNVDALLVVGIQVREIRRRYVSRLFNVHTAAHLMTETRTHVHVVSYHM